MSTQQDIYAAGSENRPPMLNKDNYAPWSSCIIRYARSRPNGKMIVESIKNGPYVRRMIATPGEPDLLVLVLESFHEQTDEELTENDIKRMDADDQAIQTIILGLPEDVYVAVDSCETAKEIWERYSLATIISNQQQPSLNQNFMQPPMTSLEDINDPTKAMNVALILFAKAMQLTAPSNNNPRTSSNPRNRQIAQLYVRQVAQNQQGYNALQNGGIQGIANQNGTGNVVAARAEGTGNGNQAMCYNCRGLGHIARNCTARPRRRDAAYLQTQLLIGDLDEIEEVNANCILMATLQHASTFGTQLDKAPEEQYTDLLEPIPKPQLVPQNDNHVTYVTPCMVQSGGTIETSSAPNEKTRAHQETVYCNLVDQVAQEDKFLDKEVDLEARIKDLENILLKRDQIVQIMHMLNPKPDLFYHPNQKMALEEHDPPVVNDLEETLELVQESHEKMRLLKKEIKPANYTKINHLSGDLLDDTTLSVARKFLNEVNSSLVTLQCVVKRKMTLEVHNWSSSAHKEVHKIISHEIVPIINQVDARVQNFEIQFLQEAAEFVQDFKYLTKEADESLDKQKSLEFKIERLLKASVERLEAQLRDPKGKSSDTPSASNTLDLLNQKLESKIVELKFQVVNYERLVHTARTRRPQPKDNTRNARVPSASKSSEVKKNVTVEEHRRTLLLLRIRKPCHLNAITLSLLFRMINLKLSVALVIQICLWCVDLGCSKHMTGNIKLLINFVWKFLGTVRFGNDHIATILGYEVAFRRNTCFIRDLDGVDLFKGNRSTNLYTINLYDMASDSPICLMAHATPTKEHLCPSYEQGKSKRASHPPKPVLNSKHRLHLLHMDLCGPMRVASINGKRYILVIVDDYSRYTRVNFLRTKDEMPEVIKSFLKKLSVRLQAPVIIVRTDNGTEFKNHVLKEYFIVLASHMKLLLQKLLNKMESLSAEIIRWLKLPELSVPRTILVAPVIQNLQASIASISFQDTAPAPTNSSNTPVSSHNVDEPLHQHAQQQRNLTPSPTASAADNVLNAVIMEPKSVKKALTDPAWIESMQEELHQFIRLDIWELVPSPDGIKPLTLNRYSKTSKMKKYGHSQQDSSSCSDGSYQDILSIRCTQMIHSVSNGHENCIYAWFIERRRVRVSVVPEIRIYILKIRLGWCLIS
nr:hypothetical protein [Tanacetum cinerariifolium]